MTIKALLRPLLACCLALISLAAQAQVDVRTAAGSGLTGYSDGAPGEARFFHPTGVVVDLSGDVFIADAANHVIRKIGADGRVTTLAGQAGTPGFQDGPGQFAKFRNPTGLAIDLAGNVYVADTLNSMIRKITPQGFVSSVAGLPGKPGMRDGAANQATFAFPKGVAVANNGAIYVADSANHTIREIKDDQVRIMGGEPGEPGARDGFFNAARFSDPFGIVVDATGMIYVADSENHAIRRVSPERVVTTVYGALEEGGFIDGAPTAARFNLPTGVAFDSSGNLYVSEIGNHALRKIDTQGNTTTIAGGQRGNRNGIGSAASFDYPFSLAIRTNRLYVADMMNHIIRFAPIVTVPPPPPPPPPPPIETRRRAVRRG